jgi:response regulator RpfG family c-di-GMP phosphodiesterase
MIREITQLPKILYVDDEPINLQLFKFNFQKQFNLLLAQSGQEALDILSKEDVKIIVTDLKMPGMNGIELIERIKKQNSAKVCMLLSAYDISEARKMGLDESKIHSYIRKPWRRNAVGEILIKALEA